MSLTKRLYEAHVGHGRKIVVSPTRGMWDGSTAKARCTGCTFAMQYQRDEKVPDFCPKCGARMAHGA